MRAECAFCPPKIADKDWEKIWRAWARSGSRGALSQAAKIGINGSEREFLRHLHYHRPETAEQIYPLPRQEALRKGKKFSRRRKLVLETLYRVRGLDRVILSQALYLNRSPSAASRSARRDLQEMLQDDFVYRAYTEHLLGPGPRPRREVPALWFAGVNARALLAENFAVNSKRGQDYFSSSRDFASWQDPYRWHKAAQPVRSFFWGGETAHQTSGDGWSLNFYPADWWDRRWSSFTIKDPIGKRLRWESDGIMVWQVNLGGTGGFVPVFYTLDLQQRAPRDAALQYANLGSIHRAGVLEKFALPTSSRALLLVFTSSAKRALEISRASQNITVATDTRVVALDQTTALWTGAEERVWQPLFHGRDPVSLVDALAYAHASAPEAISEIGPRGARRKI